MYNNVLVMVELYCPHQWPWNPHTGLGFVEASNHTISY